MSELEHTKPPASTVCAGCATIDFENLLSTTFPELADGAVFEKRPIIQLKGHRDASLCSFCWFLNAVLPLSDRQNPQQSDVTTELYMWNPRARSDAALAGKPDPRFQFLYTEKSEGSSAWLCVQSDSFQRVRILDPNKIDFSILRKWMLSCRDNHKEQCGLQMHMHSKVPGLRVINVHQGTLEVAEEHVRYAALSYVWGQPSKGASTSQSKKLPDELPATIRDAMIVTERLGLQYLWIDRYCIPQDESEAKEKADQIQRMDQVYHNAELCIIAAAGEDPEHGLPGVGSTPRRPQPWAQIGKHVVISALTPPERLIHDSRWNSRAWTYQEAMCSRRRLLFTDEQVLFECQQMNCREAIDCDWALQDCSFFKESGSKRSNFFNAAGWIDSDPALHETGEIFHHIENYSRRHLTLDSDALNAVLGVLRLYKPTMFHHWGVPIFPPRGSGRAGGETRTHETLEEGFLASLCWEVTRPCEPGRRRPEFPSWSWVGCSTPALNYVGIRCDHSMTFSRGKSKSSFRPPSRLAVRVSLGRQDGSFGAFERLYNSDIKCDRWNNLSSSICLRGWMVDLDAKLLPCKTFSSDAESDLFAWPAGAADALDGDNGVFELLNLDYKMGPDGEPGWKGTKHILGILMQEYVQGLTKEIFVLAALQVDDGIFERIGHIDLLGDWTRSDSGLMESEWPGPTEQRFCPIYEKWRAQSRFRNIILR